MMDKLAKLVQGSQKSWTQARVEELELEQYVDEIVDFITKQKMCWA